MFEPENHDRRSIRLQGYDYSQSGAYFVTICAANRRCLFGEIVAGEIQPNNNGTIVSEQWFGLPNHYPNIKLDQFALMPNHIHGVIHITDGSPTNVGAGFQPAQSPRENKSHHGLPEIIRGFKTYSARKINELQDAKGRPVWQRNYYEHVVRSETSLHAIRTYILENPLKWHEDSENPRFYPRLNSSL